LSRSRYGPASGVAQRSTWFLTDFGRIVRRSCSPLLAGATRCFGSLRAPASRPAPTCARPPPEQPGSPSCRSWSTLLSSTPIGLPTSRWRPCKGRCPAETTASPSGISWSPPWNVSRFPTWFPAFTGGTLRFALAQLAALPRAAVVVEDRYSAIFKLDRVRPAVVADGVAELQVRWPTIALVFCETRPLAEEWTYRYLAAAHTWAATEPAALERIGIATGELDNAPAAPEPSTAEVRAWARAHGLTVPARGKLRPEVWDTWRAAHL
jgi:hypothetical protein